MGKRCGVWWGDPTVFLFERRGGGAHPAYNDLDAKLAVRPARLLHRGRGEIRDNLARFVARQSSRAAGDAAGYGLFPDGADEIPNARTPGAIRLFDQGIVDKRVIRVSGDARTAGLRRVSKTKISRDVRAGGFRSRQHEQRFAGADDGSVRGGRRRSARPDKTLG